MWRPCKILKTDSSTSPDEVRKITSKDRISQLPDELVSLILKKLSLRVAARTSVLSLRWKHVWSLQSNLIFNMHTMLQQYPESKKIRWWREGKEKFVKRVNQFVDSYQGTNIISFEVIYFLDHDNTEDIDRWISFAIKMGVEDLCLNLCISKNSHPCKGLGYYILRKELFDGAKNSVKKLRLVRCQLGQNLFISQLIGLESLSLNGVPLVEYDLRNMISCLVNLKYLKFYYCTLPPMLYIGPLRLLKSFHVSRCFVLKYIKLSNVNLSELHCTPLFLELDINGVPNYEQTFSRPTEFNSEGVPNLECLYYRRITGKQLQSLFSIYLRNLPNLKTLFVSTGSLWRKYIPESLGTFSSVTELRLDFYKERRFDILKMVSILKAFPSLHKLVLMMSRTNDFHHTEPNLGNYVHEHLEHVEIGGFHGTPMQIKFAIYLLNHASLLKRLIFKKKLEEQEWNESERVKIYKELKKFSEDRVLIV